jgi:Holliday junction resolvase-like predicted endonuclease
MSVGKTGELIAQKFLIEKLKYRLIKSNFRLKFGEIDLLCFDLEAKSYAVCEVRTRTTSSKSFYLTIDTVFPKKKLARLNGLASFIELKYGLPCRIDLMFVLFVDSSYKVKYYKDVMTLM